MSENDYKIPKYILIIKFYNINYERHIKPKMWIQKLNNVLDLKNKDNFDLLASYITNKILKDANIFEKKKVLYIYMRKSRTGKTTTVANSLWHYFGETNVVILSTSKNFQLETLIDKELAILDEYRYSPKRREIDLKLF